MSAAVLPVDAPDAASLIRVYRVEQAAYATDPFSGLGGLYAEGRWHPLGVRLSYASETSSLALLEKIVGTNRARLAALAPHLVLVEATVPASSITTVEQWAELPDGWDTEPPPYGRAVQALGARFVREAPSAVLSVPSAVNRHERNLLINPAHADAAQLRIVGTVRLRIDERLYRGAKGEGG